MIEIAPEEYHKILSLENAMLYCFSLNIDGKIGWRLPTYDEIEKIVYHAKYTLPMWHTGLTHMISDPSEWDGEQFATISVRDL